VNAVIGSVGARIVLFRLLIDTLISKGAESLVRGGTLLSEALTIQPLVSADNVVGMI
jgi:hypothetical protein